MKLLNESSTRKPISACSDQKHRGLTHADLPGGNRTRARALDAAVEIAIDDVVPGAAGAAHGEGADEEQREMQEVRRRLCAATAASADDHQHGNSNSQEPIGRSRRASRR